jgi:hypothetical protein
LLLVSISSNNTRIRGIMLTARQPCIDALSDDGFELDFSDQACKTNDTPD